MAGMVHLRSGAPALPLLFGALLLASALAPARAESLMERRNAMQKGSHQGVVILGDTQDNAAPETETAGAASTADADQPSGLRAIFNKLPPPGGCPFNVARTTGCPDQGVAVPTGESSSSNMPRFAR
jgi:hypothetical protein